MYTSGTHAVPLLAPLSSSEQVGDLPIARCVWGFDQWGGYYYGQARPARYLAMLPSRRYDSLWYGFSFEKTTIKDDMTGRAVAKLLTHATTARPLPFVEAFRYLNGWVMSHSPEILDAPSPEEPPTDLQLRALRLLNYKLYSTALSEQWNQQRVILSLTYANLHFHVGKLFTQMRKEESEDAS